MKRKTLPLLLKVWAISIIILPTFSQGSPADLSLSNKKIEETKPNYDIQAQYPELQNFSKREVQDRINEGIRGSVAEVINSFKKDLRDFDNEFPKNMPPGMTNTLDLNYKIAQESKNLLSLSFDVATYFKGAAHPNSRFLTLNFNMKNGKTLKLADLFEKNSNYLSILSKIAVQELMKKDPDGMMQRDWVKKGAGPDEKNFENFVLTPQALVLLFNPYQVAPYVVGPSAVSIPYSKIARLLKPKGPLGIYLK